MADQSPLSMIENEPTNSIGTFLPKGNSLASSLVALLAVRHVTLQRLACAFPSCAEPAAKL